MDIIRSANTMYRYLSYTRDVSTMFVMKLFPYKQLNDVYYSFHTQDPEWCVQSLLEMNNLSEEVFDNIDAFQTGTFGEMISPKKVINQRLFLEAVGFKSHRLEEPQGGLHSPFSINRLALTAVHPDSGLQ